MLRKFAKRRVLAAFTVIGVLALAGGAFAYFTSSGSAGGYASVGTNNPLSVTLGHDSTGVLYPGSGTETLSFSITNPNAGNVQLSGVTAAVTSAADGNVIDANTSAEASGCAAWWFTATPNVNGTLPYVMPAGGPAVTGSVAVTMQDSGGNQDACQGVLPEITLSTN